MPWILLSVAIHGAALAAALLRPSSESGVLDQEREAVSIEQHASEVLEAIESTAIAAPGAASAAATVGHMTSVAGQPPPEEARAVSGDVSQAFPATTPDLLPAPPVQSVAAIDAEAAAEPSTNDDDVTPEPAKPEQARPEQKPSKRDQEPRRVPPKNFEAKSASTSGGPTSRAQRAKDGAGRASASAGDIVGYAARVRAAVARHKPSGGGSRGTAVVSFSVTRGGGLASASLVRSSGNSTLDRLALGSVRGASFPAPPAGLSAGQLRFSVPFHFQ